MPRPLPLRSVAVAVALSGLSGAAAGCSDDGPVAGPAAFCAELVDAGPELTPVPDPATAGQRADRMAELGRLAPEDIRSEWDQLTELFRAVAALDPADPSFRQSVLTESGRTIAAAAEVTSWVQQRCGIDLTGDSLTTVPTTAGAGAPATPATTVVPAGSTVPVVPVPTG